MPALLASHVRSHSLHSLYIHAGELRWVHQPPLASKGYTWLTVLSDKYFTLTHLFLGLESKEEVR